MPFPALGDIIEICRRERRIDTVQPHKGGANDRRPAVISLIVFHGSEFAGRESHPRMRVKTHRIVSRMAGRPHQLLAGTPFFQKLAEAVKIDPRQVGLQPRVQPGMRRLCFSSHSSRSPVGCRMIIRRLNK